MSWIYEINEDNSARFLLGEKGKRPLVCLGVNPSTAEPNKLDNTLRIVKGWSETLGFDGWVMLNLYPQRVTNPNDLHKKPDYVLIGENINKIHEAFGKNFFSNSTVWAAWGTLIEKRSYLKNCLRTILGISGLCMLHWITIGHRSNAGHPHHPLYLSKKAEVAEFSVIKYLEELRK